MNLENLDLKDVRKYMLDEVNLDMENDDLYYSSYLKEDCKDVYSDLLKNEIEFGNPESFSKSIKDKMILRKIEMTKRGPRNVRKNAHETLGEGEFNRFYIRGLCKKAIKQGLKIEVYRAKQVNKPREKSKNLIEEILDPKFVLEDFRTNFGRNTSSEISKPNSGISLRLIKQ